MYFISTRSTETTMIYIFIMGHIIINTVPALSGAALVDQAWVDPVYYTDGFN